MKRIIHWFRRDLRLSDNTSLYHAGQDADEVIPVFCLDPEVLGRKEFGSASVQFMLESLAALQKNLEAIGSRLILRQGNSLEELLRLAKEVKASAIYWNRKYDPYTWPRDIAIERACQEQNIITKTFSDLVIHEPLEIKTDQNKPYTVFTPFSKRWLALPRPKILPRFKKGNSSISSLASLILPTLKELGFSLESLIPKGGEREAHHLLKSFIQEKLHKYGDERDYPALSSTSHLSPHLRFGTLSIRTLYETVTLAQNELDAKGKKNAEIYLKELVWREFYVHVLYHFPHVIRGAFRSEYDRLEWSDNKEHFQAWCEGKTGYPLVDAAMRQLNTTGWMHNRLRMVTAMFLTKDLHLPWQWGEEYFLSKLADGDLAANNGGWQWSASTGTDAAPYFRIFSPISQSQKFDPKGEFIKQYVPELSHFSEEEIHAPWEKALEKLKATSYPQPLVDHSKEREKTFQLFKKIKYFP